MYFANLRPFKGEDWIVSAEDFRTIYNLTMSAARGILSQGEVERHVFIMRENIRREPNEPIDQKASTPICSVFRWIDDTISVVRSADLKHLFLPSGRVL